MKPINALKMTAVIAKMHDCFTTSQKVSDRKHSPPLALPVCRNVVNEVRDDEADQRLEDDRGDSENARLLHHKPKGFRSEAFPATCVARLPERCERSARR